MNLLQSITLFIAVPFTLLSNSAVAAADIQQGQQLFQQCSICHNNAKDAGAKVGPNLWGILGREIAADPAYTARYSGALKSMTGQWDAQQLSDFLANPQAVAPGTIMGFAGMNSASDRGALIAYINSQSDSPIDYQLEQQNEPVAAVASAVNIGKLFAADGAQTTFRYCSACHSERIVTQQGLSRADWEELLEWMVDEQDMTAITEPDYTKIIGYLSQHYGIDRPNFPGKK